MSTLSFICGVRCDVSAIFNCAFCWLRKIGRWLSSLVRRHLEMLTQFDPVQWLPASTFHQYLLSGAPTPFVRPKMTQREMSTIHARIVLVLWFAALPGLRCPSQIVLFSYNLLNKLAWYFAQPPNDFVIGRINGCNVFHMIQVFVTSPSGLPIIFLSVKQSSDGHSISNILQWLTF